MLLGDINGDGNITSFDARYVLRVVARLEILPDDLFKIADVDFDGKITANDARMILRVAARLDASLAPGANNENLVINDSVNIEQATADPTAE